MIEYQQPSEFVASQAPPGVSPARTTLRCWLYSVDTSVEFASIKVSRVRADVVLVESATGLGATVNDVADVPGRTVEDPPRVPTPPGVLASDDPKELPIST